MLPKPSRFARLMAKDERRKAKSRERKRSVMTAAKEWLKVRAVIFDRDRGKCRACGVGVKLLSNYWFDRAEAHHITYRSAGGTDDVSNLITLCHACHAKEHDHALSISGNADQRVSFTKIDVETGRTVRQWEG